MSSSLPQQLFEQNAQWASDVLQLDPNFFKNSAKGQQPKVLWIGCGDSRVPESVLMGCKPGDIFVHRNVANQIQSTDDNLQSLLAYAVLEVKVDHVVVAGHSRCGGALASYKTAASSNPSASLGLGAPLDRWLAPVIALARERVVPQGLDEDAALELLVEENVKAQVNNIVATEAIQKAWAAGLDVQVHGWVYHLETGLLQDLNVTQQRQ